MPFIDNVYITGEVPDRDLKRLTGRRDKYTLTQEVLLWLTCLASTLTGYIVLQAGPLGQKANSAVGVSLLAAGFVCYLLWWFWNPRARNRATLARYERDGRIVHGDTMAYKFVMSPKVRGYLKSLTYPDELSDAVDEFVDWYHTRPFASVTSRLLYQDNARELADLRTRLEAIGDKLQENGSQNDMPLHVDKVITPLIRERRDMIEEGLDCFPDFRDKNLAQIAYLDSL